MADDLDPTHPETPDASDRHPSGGPAEPAEPTRPRRRVWPWLVPGVAVVVAGALVLAASLEHDRWVGSVERYHTEVARAERDAVTARAEAEAAYVPRLAVLAGAEVVGEAVLAQSEGQVDDDAVRDPLAAALPEAATLVAAPVEYPVEDRTVDALTRPNPFFPRELPERRFEVVTGSTPSPEALDDATAAVVGATQDVASAWQQWAYDGLEDAVAEGRPVLTESAGLVSDEGHRTSLDAALAAADPSLDAGVGGAPVAEVVAQRDAVLGATEAVWTDRLELTLQQRRELGRAQGVDCTVDRCVALTFDDGPGADTERLLKTLAEKHVTATFFLVGTNVEKRPDVVRDTAAGGHLLANHTWDHPQLTTLDDDEVRAELERTQDAITEASGETPTFLRPPYGDVDDRVRSVATRTGLQVILWNLDTLDWKTKDAAETRRRAVEGARPGSVVLMHDIHATTVDAVPGIIDDLRAEGYTLVTVDLLAP
ncbi:polysaccharide deacetylase family protein [Cellulosimicrobium cellulans]|uniref:polysaccharide deacetylase family protein n=1 Tax=Cellulosimicrobium cellulans TaxID=1710 RepID=UPI0028AE4BC6|nr:polysaccharide deacetylase family protein [Cellulosimicrobium cellulans]